MCENGQNQMQAQFYFFQESATAASPASWEAWEHSLRAMGCVEVLYTSRQSTRYSLLVRVGLEDLEGEVEVPDASKADHELLSEVDGHSGDYAGRGVVNSPLNAVGVHRGDAVNAAHLHEDSIVSTLGQGCGLAGKQVRVLGQHEVAVWVAPNDVGVIVREVILGPLQLLELRSLQDVRNLGSAPVQLLRSEHDLEDGERVGDKKPLLVAGVRQNSANPVLNQRSRRQRCCRRCCQ